MPRPAYDAVVATRNRPEALRLSLPLLLAQSPSPARLIIVDASDDPDATRRAVLATTRGAKCEVILEETEPGLTRQRNIGLARVTAPVVLFIDDDSLLHPGAAAAILDVYTRDSEGAVAAVAAAEAAAPPEGALPGGAYRMTAAHRREARLRALRNRIERHIAVLKPAIALGAALNACHAAPDWLDDLDAIPVEYMTGFRMSFRTEALRSHGFDEALTGYALDEDIDASLTAMRAGLVVGARRARIHHHRCPGGRGDAFELGRMEILNRAYVLLKHASGPLGSAALTAKVWRQQRAFALMQLTLCALRATSPDGRARLVGAWRGHRQAARLWHAPAQDRSLVPGLRLARP